MRFWLALRRLPGRKLLTWAEHLLAAVGLFFILYFVGFDLSTMTTASMEPALKAGADGTGDWILTEKLSYWFRGPRRWEVVTFRDRDGLQIMKRVAALPGESISMPDVGDLRIDGASVVMPAHVRAIRYLPFANLRAGRSVDCGEGWFVLGDFTRDSADSRYEGPVLPRRLVGRAWLVLWPPSRFGFVR